MNTNNHAGRRRLAHERAQLICEFAAVEWPAFVLMTNFRSGASAATEQKGQQSKFSKVSSFVAEEILPSWVSHSSSVIASATCSSSKRKIDMYQHFIDFRLTLGSYWLPPSASRQSWRESDWVSGPSWACWYRGGFASPNGLRQRNASPSSAV